MTTKTAAQRGTAASVKSLAITAICLVLVYVFTAVVWASSRSSKQPHGPAHRRRQGRLRL